MTWCKACVLLSFFFVFQSFSFVNEEYPWNEWKQLEKTLPDENVSFTLALQLQNLRVLDALSEQLTTPGSPEYRKWKTIEELNNITRPDTRRVNGLMNWLSRYHLQAEDYGDFIQVSGKVHNVEKAFRVEYYEFQNILRSSKFKIHRSTVHPTIPVEFRGFIVFITGVSNFPYPTRSSYRKADVASYYMVPQTLRAQYQVPDSYIATNANSSQGVVEFAVEAGVSIDDLQQFMQLTGGNQNANLSYTVGNFLWLPVGSVDFESTLDVQYIMAMAPGVPTSFYVVNGWIYDFTTLVQQRAASNLPNPLVFSISYGWAEADQCSITGQGTGCGQLGGSSQSYVENTNVGFQKLGLMGISVFVASGDAGAASKDNIHCLNRRTPIQPDYPASSNFVTSVGGTMYSSASVLSPPLPPFCTEDKVTCAGTGEEVVSQPNESLITSGGGFSNVAATPSWQLSQVQAYLSSGALLPPSSDFNSSGRAYPDLAALAHHFMIVERGITSPVDGTSASSPLTAALFSLINDNLLNSGKAPLGFLNPTLYSVGANPNVFNDVIYGNNTTTEKTGLGFIGPCTTPGYGATTGWDSVTGFGTPNYSALLNAIMNL